MESGLRSPEELARMESISRQLPKDLDGLTAKLSDPDHQVRSMAAARMLILDDPRAVEPLLNALDDPHHQVRASAALGLGHYESTASLPAVLEHLLHDPAPGVRGVCAYAAGRIGTDDAMEALKNALDDADWHVRTAACSMYAVNQDKRALDEIRNLLKDSVVEVRSTAAAVLILLDEIDEEVMGVLVGDPSWDVRRQVAVELIRAGVADRRIMETVEGLMQEPEAQEYEARVAEFRAEMKSEECDGETSGPEEELLRELEEMQDKPLPEILAAARALVGK